MQIRQLSKLMEKLEELPLNKLQDKLKEIVPKKWESMNQSDKNNPRRLIRALEIQANKFKQKEPGLEGMGKSAEISIIGLTAPRKALYERSDKRVISRISQGMVEEART